LRQFITPDWKAEAATFTPKTPKLRTVTLGAYKLGLYINLSRECIQDAGGIAAEVSSRMAFALGQTFDAKILNGDGVACPLGVIHSDAAVVHARQTANQVMWDDITEMLARLHPAFVANAAWYVNPSVMPYLLQMSDASSRAIWMPNGSAAAASPGLLYGRPVFLTDKIPQVGSKGDVVLADLSMYAVGIRQQISVERSDSVEWYADLVSLRTITRCDGRPLLDEKITPQNGSDLSAFVVLE
jgi:HK97 family phage major capsid protein